MRTVLTILAACAALVISLAAGLFTGSDAVAWPEMEVEPVLQGIIVLWLLLPLFFLLGTGIVLAPRLGAHSIALGWLRGLPQEASGNWAQTIGLSVPVSLLLLAVSAALRIIWPESFRHEAKWGEWGLTDLASALGEVGIEVLLFWLCLLTVVLWAGKRILPAMSTERLSIVGIIVLNALLLATLVTVADSGEDPLNWPTLMDYVLSGALSVFGAWLYATRGLEHGVLVLVIPSGLVFLLRPLWTHLGI